MRNFILNFLIKYYINNNEILKLTDEEEMELYKFNSSDSVVKVLKNNITNQTLRHFNANTEQERWMIKGAALTLKLIKDRHNYALMINELKDKDKKIKAWKSFKIEYEKEKN